jgi:hypothetical protein
LDVTKKSTLTDAERAANLARGLTATGKVPKGPSPGIKKHKVPSQKGQNALPSVTPGDYRHLGYDFTPERKNMYLAALAKHGLKTLARIEVGISQRTEERHRSEDPLFRAAMDEALRQYGAVLAKEIHRRGVEGVQEPVYGNIGGQGGGTGVVGWVTRYSDRLLMVQAQRFEPEYTPKQKVEHSGSIKAEGLGLEDLCPESQDDLRRILERELARKATNGTPTEPQVS